MACSGATVEVFWVMCARINRLTLTYMNVDKRLSAAVQGARKLTVVCDVPNVDFVRSRVSGTSSKPFAIWAERHRVPRDSIDRIAEFMCGLEFLFRVLPICVWGRINR